MYLYMLTVKSLGDHNNFKFEALLTSFKSVDIFSFLMANINWVSAVCQAGVLQMLAASHVIFQRFLQAGTVCLLHLTDTEVGVYRG